VVGTFHAYYDPSVASALYTAEAKLLWLIWRRVDLGLAVSRAAADCIESRVKTSVRVIPNGIDAVESNPTRTGDRRSPRRLLFVGRLERRKGFPVVVQAFATLARGSRTSSWLWSVTARTARSSIVCQRACAHAW